MSSIASYMQANTTNEPDQSRFDQGGQMSEDDHGESSAPKKEVKKFRLRLSQRLHHAAELAFVSYLLLIVSFGSPYWLASYSFTNSAFKRLGLWDFCFQDYVHPTYQYDIKFTGCHWIYSTLYTPLRDWLQPGWFIFVQATVTLSLCISTLGLVAVSIIFMHFLIQYQLIILCVTLLCHMASTMLLGFAVITFFMKCKDRNWILYPDFNHLGWAFYFALFAWVGTAMAAYLFYREVKDLKGRMLKMKRLIVATNGLNQQNQFGVGDQDSIDAVYATRSLDVYQSVPVVGNESQRSQRSQQPIQTDLETQGKKAGLVYPYYTRV